VLSDITPVDSRSGHGEASDTSDFFPLAIDFLQYVKAAASAETPTRTARINNRQRFVVVETDCGEGNVSTRTWVAALK
jgi:hypothetical protein